jgi:hypothetical protein
MPDERCHCLNVVAVELVLQGPEKTTETRRGWVNGADARSRYADGAREELDEGRSDGGKVWAALYVRPSRLDQDRQRLQQWHLNLRLPRLTPTWYRPICHLMPT